MSISFDRASCLGLLGRWMRYAESEWYPLPGALPGHADLGCYGTGYEHWGVQSNQKYVAAMSVLADRGEDVDRSLCRDRAMAALRYSLRTHHTGDLIGTDGKRWDSTWISVLGLERMMFAYPIFRGWMNDEDHARMERMLTAEANWRVDDYHRAGNKGIDNNRWASSGRNDAESNLWNGFFLWRVSQMYGDHRRVAEWREQAHRFLMNAVSVGADAKDERVVAGRKVKDWHIGAGFFDHFAFDHHGYMNVGYMTICASHQAIGHLDCKLNGWTAPESLYHHAADLWAVLRTMIFGDGRLARIGGDSRVRYAYCQEYLLPVLLFAADYLKDPHAIALADAQVKLIAREAEQNEDGSFYGERLGWLAMNSPYYYTRLESDRAGVLAMGLVYADLVNEPGKAGENFEQSAATIWSDPEHGDVMHRCATRLASFAWRGYGLTQGLCLPPDAGDMAEWELNLAGVIRFVGNTTTPSAEHAHFRRLESNRIETFEGGFMTIGSVIEGERVLLEEGWNGSDMARHQLMFVALPDGHTVVCLQHCQVLDKRAYMAQVSGMNLCVPNDVQNDFKRTYAMAGEQWLLESPAFGRMTQATGSRWVNVDGKIGAVGLYGAQEMSVQRWDKPMAGRNGGLYVDKVQWGVDEGCWSVDAGQVVLDAGWCVISGISAEETQHFSQRNAEAEFETGCELLRAVKVWGCDGRQWIVAANFDRQGHALTVGKMRREIAGGDGWIRVMDK